MKLLCVIFAIIACLSFFIYLKFCGNFKDCIKKMSEARKMLERPDNDLGDD